MTGTLEPRVRELLREAAEWRMLGLLLECPGDDWRRRIADLAATLSDPALLAAAELAREQGSEGLYHSIFGPGGPAPPREVSYCDSLQLGLLLSELEAYYRAFAYEPVTGEAADHVSVEAGFIAFLHLKEAYALASENSEQASVTADAAARFVKEHLSWIAEPLSAALCESGIGYLEAAGQALVVRVGPSRQRMSIPDGQLAAAEDGSDFCCTAE